MVKREKGGMARRTKHPVSRDPYWEVVQSLMQDILYGAPAANTGKFTVAALAEN